MMSRVGKEVKKRINNLGDIFSFFLDSDTEEAPVIPSNPPSTNQSINQLPQPEIKIEIVTKTIPVLPKKEIEAHDKKSVAALIARESEKRHRISRREHNEVDIMHKVHNTLKEGWELPSNPDEECHGFTLV